MRGLIFNCNKFSFSDIKKSTKPHDIKKINVILTKNEFKNIILVFLCIEKDDKENFINAAIKRIINLNKKYYKNNKIAIAPFVHLSKNIEVPEKSIKICKLFAEKLRESGFKVSEITFGTHKSSHLDFLGNPYNVSYFEF